MRLAAMAMLAMTAACATATSATAATAATSASSSAATTRPFRVEATLPVGMPAQGHAFVALFTPEEIEAKVPQRPERIFDVMGRIRGVADVDARDDVLAFDVDVPADAPVVLQVSFDAAGHGLEALFGPRPGLAQAFVEVAPGSTSATTTLLGKPPEPPRESCTKERQTLLRLDAPETKRPGDDGVRVVCVQVPPSYGDGDRRYPLLFVFPGFSGHHANNDGWNARAIFEAAASAAGVEVIIVGVGTRTGEGTSYFDRSEGFGDWDGYFVERLIPEIDKRFRSDGRRALVGHSTGGWNAIHLATTHPELVVAVGASSPDPLDLHAWLRRGDHVKGNWHHWLRAEHEMGSRGQFVSWAASWSADPSAPRGFRFPADPITGVIDEAVFAQWQARAPLEQLKTPSGLAAAQRLSGHIVLTAGRADEFDLFAPTALYADALKAAGVDVLWLPTPLGHFGHDDERWGPMAKTIMSQLASP